MADTSFTFNDCKKEFELQDISINGQRKHKIYNIVQKGDKVLFYSNASDELCAMTLRQAHELSQDQAVEIGKDIITLIPKCYDYIR